MNVVELQNFAKLCKNMGVDVEGANPQLLEFLLEKFKGDQVNVPVNAPMNVEVSAPADADVADDTNKSESVQSTATEFKDGIYQIHGRLSIISSGEYEYKGVLKGIDLVISGRKEYPTFSVDDDNNQRFFRLVRKMYRANKDLFVINKHGGGRETSDTKEAIGQAFVRWGKNGSIKSVSKIILKDEFKTIRPFRKVTVIKPAQAPVPVPVPVPVPATAIAMVTPTAVLVLSVRTTRLDKNDPVLANDMLLRLFGYNPAISIKELPVEKFKKVLGRIGEIEFNKVNPDWSWNNTRTDNCDYFDFKHNHTPTTIDLKTIINPDHNLMIEKKKIDSKRMADIFSLSLVSEHDDYFEVKAEGFITKEKITEYIQAIPRCLMPNGNTYKIEKWCLSPQLDLT